MKNVEFVLVGDVIKSRQKFDPSEWKHFHESIAKINKQFKKFLKIPITIYSGDSFGGICTTSSAAAQIVLAVQEYKKYHRSRIVLIEDEVSFGLDNNNFLTLEGPALWKSQGQLEKLKKTPAIFLADLQGDIETRTMNSILNLILSIRDDWNTIEWEVYKQQKFDLTQKELAHKIGVTQQYISKITKTSKLKLILEAENNLIPILNGIHNNLP